MSHYETCPPGPNQYKAVPSHYSTITKLLYNVKTGFLHGPSKSLNKCLITNLRIFATLLEQIIKKPTLSTLQNQFKRILFFSLFPLTS